MRRKIGIYETMAQYHKSAARNFLSLLKQAKKQGGMRTHEQRNKVLDSYNSAVDDCCECDEENAREGGSNDTQLEHCMHCTRRQQHLQKQRQAVPESSTS